MMTFQHPDIIIEDSGCAFVVTQIWGGKRRIRFRPKCLEEAADWLVWLQRNEPETEPAIQLKAAFPEENLPIG